MASRQQTPRRPAVPVLHVTTPDGRVFRFTEPFQIGRDHDCDVRVNDSHVSRKHVTGSYENGAWCLRDLKSANGMFVDGRRVETTSVGESLSISLGADGPCLTFEVEPRDGGTQRKSPLPETIKQGGSETRILAGYQERYFGSGASQGRAGGQTRMIRRAFEHVQRKQRRKYAWIVGVLAAAALAAVGTAGYKHWQITRQQSLALDMFYAMKALDVDIANVERSLATSGTPEARAQARGYMARRRELENTYDKFVSVLNLYDSSLSEEDRLILRVTRLFGECELAAPTEYLMKVKSYIKKWQSSPRYERAIRQAEQMGFAPTIVEVFREQNLPPQFFYLAMQESNFDPFTSGPPTYAGIAKGMWQFIPETGKRYGLKIGPLAKVRQEDGADDRHDWKKATTAAARYIKDIYATDAQASGLLVMASYNWGEGRVIKLLQSMPANPGERNFWRVLEKHRDRVPDQTYDYVFYIVAAAVIGENPRLFGFQFDNPLAFAEQTAAAGRDSHRPARADADFSRELP
jgi:membrane-bound lytic murein transglycosylase D